MIDERIRISKDSMKSNQMKQNVKYKIIYGNHFEIYAIKENGFIQIRCRDGEHDFKWLDDTFINVRLLTRNDDAEYGDCYLLLRDDFDSCSIVELTHKKIVKCFHFSEYVTGYKRIVEKNGEDVKDVVLILWNKDDCYYCVWSLVEGILYSTDEDGYKELKRLYNGAIIDNKYSIDDDGYLKDISSYRVVGDRVYYSDNKNDYIFLVDDENDFFLSMEQDGEDEDIMILTTERYIYKFNKETGELICESPACEYDTDWSAYADIAYEGHSRLELGLED